MPLQHHMLMISLAEAKDILGSGQCALHELVSHEEGCEDSEAAMYSTSSPKRHSLPGFSNAL